MRRPCAKTSGTYNEMVVGGFGWYETCTCFGRPPRFLTPGLSFDHSHVLHVVIHRHVSSTFAGDLLDAGVDLATVQSLMGNSTANTTARYDRRGERAKRDGVKLLHVPYRKRER